MGARPPYQSRKTVEVSKLRSDAGTGSSDSACWIAAPSTPAAWAVSSTVGLASRRPGRGGRCVSCQASINLIRRLRCAPPPSSRRSLCGQKTPTVGMSPLAYSIDSDCTRCAFVLLRHRVPAKQETGCIVTVAHDGAQRRQQRTPCKGSNRRRIVMRNEAPEVQTALDIGD